MRSGGMLRTQGYAGSLSLQESVTRKRVRNKGVTPRAPMV